MLKAPCKDCEKRHTNCHSNCKEYKKYREELDAQNAKRRFENLTSPIYIQFKKKKKS